MRKTCLECVAKHLGSAAVYIEEVAMGYPLYFGYVYGELNHAASECLAEYPDLAAAIREHRIRWSATRGEPIEKQHLIPFEAMFDYIDLLERVGSVEIPEEVLEGLPRNEDGKVVYSMDTRPAMNARSRNDANFVAKNAPKIKPIEPIKVKDAPKSKPIPIPEPFVVKESPEASGYDPNDVGDSGIG